MQTDTNTFTRILDTAQDLIQTRGYHAFSYADVAASLGIRKASIHYYFPSKSDLGQALVARYRSGFSQALTRIEHERGNAFHKLEEYVGLYAQVLQEKQKMCLCGMLAADQATLPQKIREEAHAFFTENVAWLTRIITEGLATRTVFCTESAEAEAQSLLASLEGAMLVSRLYADGSWFEAVSKQILARLRVVAA